MNTRITELHHDGLTFNVVDSGPLDGDPVVLLHGFPERASAWAQVTRTLNEAGFRTLALDQRGYSPGARPRGVWNYRVSKLAGDVAALAREVGQPVHVVGHDWGAIVAWQVALAHADLVRTLTVVSVPHPGAYLKAMVVGPQLYLSRYMVTFNVPGLMEVVARLQPARVEESLAKAGAGPHEIQTYREDVLQAGALTGALNWYRAMKYFSFADLLTRCSVPTTLVWSNGDIAISRKSAELCGDHVAADYTFVELDGSHWIPSQQPEVLAHHILQRIDPDRVAA